MADRKKTILKRKDAPTFREAIDRYIEGKQNVLFASSIRGYRTIQKHRFPELMDMRVDKITKSDVQKAVNTACRTLAAKTIVTTWGFISTVLADNGQPRFDITLPQLLPKEPVVLDPNQIKAFTQAVAGANLEIPMVEM